MLNDQLLGLTQIEVKALSLIHESGAWGTCVLPKYLIEYTE